MTRIGCLALAILLAPDAHAQSAAQLALGAHLELAAGTPVHFATVEELSSKRQHKGDQIVLKTVGDTRVDGRIVIPANSTAIGVIADSRGTGGFGVSGKLWLSPSYLSLAGVTIRFAGQTVSGRGAPAETVIGTAILGAMISGTTAVVPAGTRVDGVVLHTVAITLPNP